MQLPPLAAPAHAGNRNDSCHVAGWAWPVWEFFFVLQRSPGLASEIPGSDIFFVLQRSPGLVSEIPGSDMLLFP